VLLAIPATTRPAETLQCAVQRAINSRPDVLRQRLAVYIASQERLLAENNLQPQLDLNGFWQTNGLGEDLDQSFESKNTNDFESWQMGVFFQIPLGRRQGRAELQAAQLRVSRERAMLEQTAHQASYEVVDAYRRLNWTYQQLEIAANRERALNQWSEGARATFENPPPGVTTVFALEMYLANLRDITDATFSKNALLADYNSALARLAEVTGSLLDNRLVEIAGDASDTLPSQLPPAEIQLPEAVAPTPATPAQPAAPAPVQPAPAQGAQPQPAPQGDPPQAFVPPAATPLAETPRSQPLPLIQMPQSVQPQDAYANLPITPAPETSAAPETSPAPEPAMPLAEAPTVEPAPLEPMPSPAPLEIVQGPPVTSAEPVVTTPTPMTEPSIAMPGSMLPEPARTAMRPDPIPAPPAEPLANERVQAAPMPLAETPSIRQPVAVAPPQQAPVRMAPHERSIVQEGPSLMMPQSVAPAPTVADEPSAAPRAAEAKSRPAAERQALRPQPTVRPNQSPALQLPSSVSASSPPLSNPQAATATGQPRPSVELQLPRSVRGATADAQPRVSPTVRPAADAAAAKTNSGQPGPKLMLPGSVRPATAEAQVPATSQRREKPKQPAVNGAALQFPTSVGPVIR
jgi:hypothetical protein